MDPSVSLLPLKRLCCAAGAPPLLSDDALDRLLESFLGTSLAEGPGALPPASIGAVLERIVDSRAGDEEKDRAVKGAARLGSALLEAARHCERKLSARHNAVAWPLPHDLSLKVFSMLDTKSLCFAAATCSLFYKSTSDPLCYVDIDLTSSSSSKINNGVVCTLIQRAGKNLRSLKLGRHANQNTSLTSSLSSSPVDALDDPVSFWSGRRQLKESSVLTRSCLLALSIDGGTAGALLKHLHLYNIEKMDNTSLCTAISSCQSLVDLEVIGLRHVELKRTLESVSANCSLIERLVFESPNTGRDDSLRSETCIDLVNGCPNISTLALRGLRLHDQKARIFAKGLKKIKVMDFSTSYSLIGTFLRFLSSNSICLEVLMLRDCLHLKEAEVNRFLTSILVGDCCKCLKHLDISNRDGLSSEEDWYYRCYNPSAAAISHVLEQRPDINLVAEFPMERSIPSFDEIQQELDSDFSLTPDSMFMASSESSYNSDQGIVDDGSITNFAVFMNGAEDPFPLAS